MNINVPLVKLIPLWIADLRVKEKAPGKPYSEETLKSYARKVVRYLSSDRPLSTESFKQYLDERGKKVVTRTVNFEDTALSRFFDWLVVDRGLWEEHPNPKHKTPLRREKDTAKKSKS